MFTWEEQEHGKPPTPFYLSSPSLHSLSSYLPPPLFFLCVSSHLFGLSNPVCASLGLQVVLWVPVRVNNDDCVCSREIDPQSSCPGGQQEAEVLGALSIEVINGVSSQFTTDRAVQPLHGRDNSE